MCNTNQALSNIVTDKPVLGQAKYLSTRCPEAFLSPYIKNWESLMHGDVLKEETVVGLRWLVTPGTASIYYNMLYADTKKYIFGCRFKLPKGGWLIQMVIPETHFLGTWKQGLAHTPVYTVHRLWYVPGGIPPVIMGHTRYDPTLNFQLYPTREITSHPDPAN